MSVSLLLLLHMCMISLECEEGGSFYSLEMVGCSCILGKYRMQPPPPALNAPPVQGGAKQSWGRCAAPWVRLHPRPAHSPPPCSGGLLTGPRGLPHWYYGPVLRFGWALLLFCLNAPSWLRILVYFHILSCKTRIYQNSWKMWDVNPSSKFWHSHLFYFV